MCAHNYIKSFFYNGRSGNGYTLSISIIKKTASIMHWGTNRKEWGKGWNEIHNNWCERKLVICRGGHENGDIHRYIHTYIYIYPYIHTQTYTYI